MENDNNNNTLLVIVREIASVFLPLKDAFATKDAFVAYMRDLGWEIEFLPVPIKNLATEAQKVYDFIKKPEFLKVFETISKIKNIVVKMKDLPTDLGKPEDWVPGTIKFEEFKNNFVTQLIQHLLVEYLQGNREKLGSILQTAGVVRITYQEAKSDTKRLAYWKKEIVLSDLIAYINNPKDILKKAYGWGENELKGDNLWNNINRLGSVFGYNIRQETLMPALKSTFGIPESVTIPSQMKLVFLEDNTSAYKFSVGISYCLLPEADGKKPGIAFMPYANGSVSVNESFSITDNLSLTIESNADLDAGVCLLIRPDEVKIVTDMKDPDKKPSSNLLLKLGLQYSTPGIPTVILGQENGSRLQIERFIIRVIGSVATNDENEILLESGLNGGKLIIKGGEGDSFLNTILGKKGIEAGFDLNMGWSSRLGIYFQGSGGLEISLPTHISFGSLAIPGLTFGIKPGTDTIPVSLAADIKGRLGPLNASIQGIGFTANFKFHEDNSGDLGPLSLTPSFKWPKGVGLSIDGGGFVGGGFLRLDIDKGEYAGGLELAFKKKIALKALGILNTKMPDGSDGFSLLIIITSEFVPIQLGFGFSLNGVGGLLGLNRTMELEPLKLGIYDGSINSILFPKDITANANRIVNDMKRIFPPREGLFTFGPMAKLTWGTPPILRVEMGLIMVVPDPVLLALLGIMRVSLPAETSPMVYIQVNFVASIDFDKKQFSLDATLFNSRIVSFTLTGNMCIRIYWGDNSNFLFSVGGFHPSFTPPPMNLPTMRRIALIIFSGNPDLQAECYLAITSNTFQFGCKLSLSFEAGPVALKGFLSFDALVQFSPFMFIVEIVAMLAVKFKGKDLLSIGLQFVLEGPSPWHAYGEGKISISFLFPEIPIHFDFTIGEDRRKTLPPVEVFDPLVEAFKLAGNWKGSIPDNTNLMVTPREIPYEEQKDKLLLHPSGVLEITQKVAPLDMNIDKFGASTPVEQHRYFNIGSLKIGDEIFKDDQLEYLKEQFAPANFREMKDADKLSSQSFVPMPAGVRIKGTDQLKASYIASLEVVYEVTYVPERRQSKFWNLAGGLFNIFIKGNAVAKSPLAFKPNRPSVQDPPKVKVCPEHFVIASTDTLSIYSKELVFETEVEANAARAKMVAKDASLLAKLQVAAAYQLD